MQVYQPPYRFIVQAKKILLPVIFLLLLANVYAQTPLPGSDTIRRGVLSEEDTLAAEEMQELPAEETEITVDSDRTAYFTYRESGSFPDSIQLRRLPAAVLDSLRQLDAFNYPDAGNREGIIAPPGQQGEKITQHPVESQQRRKRLSQQSWFQTLLWMVIIAGFLVFLFIWLSGSQVGLFRKKATPVAGNDESSESEDIFAINYQKEIDRAAAAGNYRLAIRLMFLRLLKTMAEKNVIRYRPDSTNLDYLSQLSSTKYYSDFFRITRNYEYSWYGQFDVPEDAYKMIRTDFDLFDRKL